MNQQINYTFLNPINKAIVIPQQNTLQRQFPSIVIVDGDNLPKDIENIIKKISKNKKDTKIELENKKKKENIFPKYYTSLLQGLNFDDKQIPKPECLPIKYENVFKNQQKDNFKSLLFAEQRLPHLNVSLQDIISQKQSKKSISIISSFQNQMNNNIQQKNNSFWDRKTDQNNLQNQQDSNVNKQNLKSEENQLNINTYQNNSNDQSYLTVYQQINKIKQKQIKKYKTDLKALQSKGLRKNRNIYRSKQKNIKNLYLNHEKLTLSFSSSKSKSQVKQINNNIYNADNVKLTIVFQNVYNEIYEFDIQVNRFIKINKIKQESIRQISKEFEVDQNNLDNLSFYFNEKIVLENYTIQELGLKNGDKLFLNFKQENNYPDIDSLPILTKPGYQMIPNQQEMLKMRQDKLSQIEKFTVYNKFAKIVFLQPVDVRRLNLDKIITLKDKCIEVYEDHQDKPIRGQGLNIPAQFHFYNCFPKEGQDYDKYLMKLLKKCDKVGMELINCGEKEGELIFQVKGF